MSTVVMTEVAGTRLQESSAEGTKTKSTQSHYDSTHPKLTMYDVLMNYITSPASILGLGGIIYAMWSNGGIDGITAMLLSLGFGTIVSAYFVTKLENSEWRRNLRRECEEKERQLGITRKDKVTMAANMGLGMPPPSTLPDDEPTREAAPEEKKKN
jgi:hypothetical protein